MEPHEQPLFDRVAERLTRRLASRTSRRSLLGQVGRGGLLLSMGAAGVATLENADVALAHGQSCPCGGGLNDCVNVASCNNYWGNNFCPAGTCECGWWTTCASPCIIKFWTDCCSTGSACDQGPRCHGSGDTKGPSCYFHKQYACGCASSAAHIVCRYWKCAGTSCASHC